MINNIVKTLKLLVCFIAFLIATSCSDDNCSDTIGSTPPYETIAIQFIDQEGKEVLMDTKLVHVESEDKNEEISHNDTFFSGFSLGNRNTIESNKIFITYNNEKIVELDYDKHKKTIKCNGDFYLIERITMASLSENYKVESQNVDNMHFSFIIRIENE